MKHSTLLVPLVIAAAGAGLPFEDDSLVYSPEEDTVLTRTHDSESHFTLERLFVVFQDVEHEIEGMEIEQTRKEVLTGTGTQTVTVERE